MLHTKKIPVLDERGNPEYLLGISEDITEHKRAEEALRAVGRRLADIIEFLPDSTFVIDAGGRVIAWNRAVAHASSIGWLSGTAPRTHTTASNSSYALCLAAKRPRSV